MKFFLGLINAKGGEKKARGSCLILVKSMIFQDISLDSLFKPIVLFISSLLAFRDSFPTWTSHDLILAKCVIAVLTVFYGPNEMQGIYLLNRRVLSTHAMTFMQMGLNPGGTMVHFCKLRAMDDQVFFFCFFFVFFPNGPVWHCSSRRHCLPERVGGEFN